MEHGKGYRKEDEERSKESIGLFNTVSGWSILKIKIWNTREEFCTRSSLSALFSE